ncbi:MAG TPA: cation:proton antiporter [Noviherbaspirillum sp.]|nr:cation:proton antiporter [Noviherbaspirillum sp.]
MPDFLLAASQLAWPFALAVAWVSGEFLHRWTGLPRISIYGLVGFLFANVGSGLLPQTEGGTFMLLANVAFGLILFELGYRINLRWLRLNPWMAASGVFEAVATFAVVYYLATLFNMPPLAALLLGSLSMSTSPAGIMRVVNEQSSSGQVTERVLHLSALNCVLAVFAFKVIIGIGVFQTSGSLLHATWSSLVVLVASAALGGLFGVALPALLRRLGNLARDATLAFAIAVILLVAVTYAFGFSPVLAALTFGLVARHRRVTLSPAQRNFGVMGDLLAVVLFFFVATTLDWQHVTAGAVLAIVLVAARFAVKIIGVAIFARASGISWRKGVLTGMGLMPISVFVILLLEQTRNVGVELVDALVPLSAMVLLLEVIGPVLTQRALIWAKETPDSTEN